MQPLQAPEWRTRSGQGAEHGPPGLELADLGVDVEEDKRPALHGQDRGPRPEPVVANQAERLAARATVGLGQHDARRTGVAAGPGPGGRRAWPANGWDREAPAGPGGGRTWSGVAAERGPPVARMRRWAPSTVGRATRPQPATSRPADVRTAAKARSPPTRRAPETPGLFLPVRAATGWPGGRRRPPAEELPVVRRGGRGALLAAPAAKTSNDGDPQPLAGLRGGSVG